MFDVMPPFPGASPKYLLLPLTSNSFQKRNGWVLCSFKTEITILPPRHGRHKKRQDAHSLHPAIHIGALASLFIPLHDLLRHVKKALDLGAPLGERCSELSTNCGSSAVSLGGTWQGHVHSKIEKSAKTAKRTDDRGANASFYRGTDNR